MINDWGQNDSQADIAAVNVEPSSSEPRPVDDPVTGEWNAMAESTGDWGDDGDNQNNDDERQEGENNPDLYNTADEILLTQSVDVDEAVNSKETFSDTVDGDGWDTAQNFDDAAKTETMYDTVVDETILSQAVDDEEEGNNFEGDNSKQEEEEAHCESGDDWGATAIQDGGNNKGAVISWDPEESQENEITLGVPDATIQESKDDEKPASGNKSGNTVTWEDESQTETLRETKGHLQSRVSEWSMKANGEVEDLYVDDDELNGENPNMRLQDQLGELHTGGLRGKYPPHPMLLDQGKLNL